MSQKQQQQQKQQQEDDEDDEPEPQRNFTLEQLHYFDGKKDEQGKDKEVYLSLNGIVFDVSNGRNFYGPDGPYAIFAGHECGAALAKMSFDDTYIDNLNACTELGFGEKNELDNWIIKFRDYRSYPIKGRLISNNILPDPTRDVTINDLQANNGTGPVPDGYATAPIYIAAAGKVFDMSFGGVTFYGPDGPYNKFAGHNVSRALGKMSLDIADIDNYSIDDFTEKETKIMNDWIKTFEERKKYPIVGTFKG
jgi:membrane-associated progesterone receptor component